MQVHEDTLPSTLVSLRGGFLLSTTCWPASCHVFPSSVPLIANGLAVQKII